MSTSTLSLSFKIDDGKGGFRDMIIQADSLGKAMGSVVTQAKKVQSSFFDCAGTNMMLANLNNALQGLSSAMSTLTGESTQFASAMAAANTMADKQGEGFDRLKDSVAELAKSVPVARDELANGLYQVISNGVPEDNWLEFLEASARSSVGGIADLGQAVGVTSTLIKNYGLEWSAAKDIQDKIQLTAKNGVTSFEQLAAALPRVAANAATLGVSVDDLMASFATLTGVSGNTAEVSTQIAAIFTALVKPSSEAGKMAEAMGIQFDAAAIKAAGGFSAFLEGLDASVKAYAASSGTLEQEIYGKLFGSAESLRALIPLTGELKEKFNANISDMANSAGTMDAAFETMSQTAERSKQRLDNNVAQYRDMAAALFGYVKPLLSVGQTALGTAANIGVVITSLGAFKDAARYFNNSMISPTLQYLGNSFNRLTGPIGRFTRDIEISAAVMGTSAKSARLLAASIKLITAGAVIGAVAGLVYIVGKLAGAWGESASAAQLAKQKQEDLAKVHNDAAVAVAEETSKVKDLVAIAQDETKAMKDRAEAVRQLNTIIPGYNAQIDETTGKYTASAKALNNYLTQLAKKYELEGAKELLAELGKERATAVAELNKLKQEKKDIYHHIDRKANQAPHPMANQGFNVGSWVYDAGDRAELAAKGREIDRKEAEIADIDSRRENVLGAYGVGLYSDNKTQHQNAPAIIPGTPVVPTGSGTGGTDSPEPEAEPMVGTLAWYDKRINDINERIKFTTNTGRLKELTAELKQLESARTFIRWQLENGGITVEELTERIQTSADKLSPIELKASIYPDVKMPEKLEVPQNITAGMFRPMEKEGAKLTDTVSEISSGFSQMFQSIAGSTDDSTAATLNWAAQTVEACAKAFAAIMAVTAAKAAESVADIPVVGWVMAGAAIAGVLASFAAIPKFADGGIAYGPTLGLFGEYPGAGSNPEVVAPLDKLRSLIGNPEGTTPVVVSGELRARGSEIVAVIANETRTRSVAGKRTGIKL